MAPVAVAFPPNLGWTHYLVLLTVTNDAAGAFYEIDAAREGLKLVPADINLHLQNIYEEGSSTLGQLSSLT